VAAVCVFPAFLRDVLDALEGSPVRVATVAAGFPHGLSRLDQRVREVGEAVEAGAQEVDVVIRREWPLTGKWELLFEEVREFRKAAEAAHLKVILATGELPTPNQIARSALTAMMAGADFVKTSTGKERVNATLAAGLAMTQAIREFREATGRTVGLKPAGGLRTAAEGLRWQRLMETELGPEWVRPETFRIGASGLLNSLVIALQEGVS
jgi:deoxyribose-phosphate aldolase